MKQLEVYQERSLSPAAGEIFQRNMRGAESFLLPKYEKKVQLVYMDPPFFTGKIFYAHVRLGEEGYRKGRPTLTMPAYEDRFENIDAFDDLLRQAIGLAHRLLSETGALYVHVDPRTSARVRFLCDEIFGAHHFVNEIIWAYQTGGQAKRYFSRKHDVILYYRKSRHVHFDLSKAPLGRKEHRSNHMKKSIDEKGRSYRTIQSGGREYTYYDDEPVYPSDVWTDIPHLQQLDPARTGYDTQKPSALLERVIAISSQEGDTVCDLFCGSGTTLAAAQKLGRAFVGVEKGTLGVMAARKRVQGALIHAHNAQGNPIARFSRTNDEVALEQYTLEEGLVDQMLPGLDAVDGWAVGFVKEGVFWRVQGSFRTGFSPKLNERLVLGAHVACDGTLCAQVVDVSGRVFYFELAAI